MIYKLLPINTDYILCAGSYFLELLRVGDGKLLQICKFDTSIYDVCLVSTIGEHLDFALATWEGVQFVRVNTGENYTTEILPMRLMELESINNVCRFRDNLFLFADGSSLIFFDRLKEIELSKVWFDS